MGGGRELALEDVQDTSIAKAASPIGTPRRAERRAITSEEICIAALFGARSRLSRSECCAGLLTDKYSGAFRHAGPALLFDRRDQLRSEEGSTNAHGLGDR